MYAYASGHRRMMHREYAVSARRRPRSPWPGRLRNAAFVAGTFVVLSLGLAKGVAGQAPTAYETITVQPGDTLWSIAAKRYPGQDVRAEVYRIEQANHLRSAALSAGERIQVPTR